jgi:class 3 adenylate cyclase
MTGLFVHAFGLSTLLNSEASPDAGALLNYFVTLILSLAGAIFGVLNFGILTRLVSTTALFAANLIFCFYLFAYGNVLLGVLAPSSAMIVSFWGTDLLAGREARKQRQFIRNAFSDYVSPKVVDALIADPSRLSLGGERRDMSYLFTDVAHFTTMAEKMDSKDLARVLNDYFEGVTSIVLRYEGMIDKFIGDAVFAIFNAPIDLSDYQESAVRCALDIDAFCEDYRRALNAQGIDFGLTRIGVHTGPAVVGNFGSSKRKSYTAQGDAVNIASRLEGLNKYIGTHICASGETRSACHGVIFRPIGSVILKGREQAIEVWEPLRNGAMTQSQLDRYNAAFALLLERSDEALVRFEALAAELPEDPCVRFHLQRLRDGVRGTELTMSEK